MNLITKENAARNVFEDGYAVVIETAISKGSDTKLKIEFDWSQCNVEQATYPGSKEKLTDLRNNANADIKRASEKTPPEVLTFEEAVASRTVYDKARKVYVLRVKDTFVRAARGPVGQKSITAQAEAMSPEKLAATIAQLLELQKAMASK